MVLPYRGDGHLIGLELLLMAGDDMHAILGGATASASSSDASATMTASTAKATAMSADTPESGLILLEVI